MPKNNKFLIDTENGDLKKIKTLLLNFDMETALIIAADYGHVEIVWFLIENGSDVNYINKNDETALLLAAKNGHTEIVNLLLENDANVNHINEINGNYTALTKATKNGHLNVIELLVEKMMLI